MFCSVQNQFIKFVWAIRKQDNIEWFEDSLKQFAGRCSVDIYITQETKEELPLQRKNLIIEITKSLTNDYNILYGRPQIQDIIQQHSQLLELTSRWQLLHVARHHSQTPSNIIVKVLEG